MNLIDNTKPIRVLLVEDSVSVRELLIYILNSDPLLQVIAVAVDGEQAVELAQRLNPDVILMDIHLPKMDGFAATRKIMETCPTRIVMVTANLIPGDVAATFHALESGALTVLAKPPGVGHPEHRRSVDELLQTVKLMSEVQVVKRWSHPSAAAIAMTPPTDMVRHLPQVDGRNGGRNGMRVIGIGASTGGPMVLREILAGLPTALAVPVLIVQHITKGFTEGFVDWLGHASGFAVRLAVQGERAQGGVAYVAPDGQHMTMQGDGAIALHLDPPEHGMRPSVSFMFRQLADTFGANAIGVLLTGMGADGAQELKGMRQAGAITIAQDRESSVVYGMPGEAAKLNAATYILAPERIASTVVQVLKQRKV